MPTLNAVIHGLVQGVSFRMSAAQEARRLGLKGWVRNRSDGSVETVATGPQASLEAYMRWLHRGPSEARVMRVDIQWRDDPPRSDSFEIRYGDD